MVMLRLRGSYFAIGMLALLLGIQLLFTSKYLSPMTRGGYGFPFIQPMSFTAMYYSALVIALVSIFTTYKIITSRFGARLLAIREDEEAAESVGINATANKITAFCISAFFGGLMAGVHVAFQNYIEPHSAFNIQWTIVPIVMVLLGGPGSVWGPVIGAVILTFVEEFLWSYFTQAYMMIYGVVMVLLVLLMPGGIIEWLKSRGTLPKVRTI
jgi:branched-chain amino acid transport system permease protein